MQLICGINPVLEALGAGSRHFDRLLVVKGMRNRRVSEAIARASQRGVPLRFEARETLDRLSGGLPHQGVIAVVSAKGVLDLDALLTEAREPAFIVVLDGVEDPRNLGAVMRTVECAGADGVVIPERHSAGLSEAAARASAGALEYVKVARVGNLAQAIDAMKARGLWVVGFDADGRERWDAVDLRRPIAMVLGGEGRGIRRLIKDKCDHLVSLPLFGHVTSLNVSVAAGIALYEAVRQRGVVPTQVRPIPMRKTHSAEAIVGPSPEDEEPDPGAVASRLAALRGQHEAADDRDDSAGFVDIHEEAAWSGGGGPTVVARRDRDHDRDRHGRRHRERGSKPQGPERPQQAGDGNQAAEPNREAGRRRRRRRRRHRREAAGGMGGAARSPEPGGAPPEVEGSAGPRQESGAPGAAGGGGARRGRRRRRRRHHRP